MVSRVLRPQVMDNGDKLLLDVTPIHADGSLGAVVRTKSGVQKVGRLSFALSTPVSIGGKLVSAATIHSESDQFNGLIDNPSWTSAKRAPTVNW